MRQLHLAHAHEIVAEDPAVMLHAFIEAYQNLGRGAMSSAENRSADHGREPRLHQRLSAYDYVAAE